MADASDLLWAIGEDLHALAVLHDREPNAELLEALRETEFPDSLALILRSEEAGRARALFRQFFSELDDDIGEEALDALSAVYADVYLHYACRAAPTESPWTDEDGLDRQASMFEVRQFYRKRDLAVQNWSERPDDHIVNELLFLAHLMAADDASALGEAASFLDAHPLRWIGDFSQRVAENSGSTYFTGVAVLTSAYLVELRGLLAKMGVVAVGPPCRPHCAEGEQGIEKGCGNLIGEMT
ncbi:MAG: molecular chaperone TorD family protein [Alphaproteobacteria bacterium]|nr:molecular chaperone TorD family protein [Alphaproteobacteria bacterium]